MVKLAITIVNYNSGEYLLRCLESIKKVSKEVALEVFILDNASTDDSIEKAKKVFPSDNYILSKTNLGFGRGHNVMLRKVKSEYILILNPDTELSKGVLKTMIELMDKRPDVGASTCEVILSNGQVDLTAHRGFPTPWASFKYYVLKDDSLYHLSKQNLKAIHEVDAISGSFFLTRKSVLDKAGLFDEDYFMYAEDIDLSMQIKKAGYTILYVPTVSIIHHKGVSSGLKKHSQTVTTASKETKLRSVNAFYDAMKIFYRKHYEKEYPFFVNWLVYGGINFKLWQAKRALTV